MGMCPSKKLEELLNEIHRKVNVLVFDGLITPPLAVHLIEMARDGLICSRVVAEAVLTIIEDQQLESKVEPIWRALHYIGF